MSAPAQSWCGPAGDLNADKIKMLAKLKAIGAEFSTTLVGEVFYREFANRRQLPTGAELKALSN
jgi:hypothetical protein